MMSKVHVISDLYLGYNEYSKSEEILPPETDLVIFNGNIAYHIKRAFLYMETMAKLYPEVQFVVNLGQTEIYSGMEKNVGEMVNNLKVRVLSNVFWPSNLHYSTEPKIIKLRDGTEVDVFCIFGFPMIHSYSCKWEDTIWSKYIHVDVTYDMTGDYSKYKPEKTSQVKHGAYPIFATQSDINKLHEIELNRVRKWELTATVHKILVTHMGPYKDTRYEHQTTTPYNIHLEKGYWIGSSVPINGINFLGSTLYSNPGRGVEARSRVFQI